MEGSSMHIHVLRMIDYFKKLGQLGFFMGHELSVGQVLQSKYKSLLGASSITKELVIIVARKVNIREAANIILQQWMLKILLNLLLHVSLWLNKGKMDLQIDNESMVVALILPSWLILELNNCYFILVLSRNIVSISEWT